MYYVFLALYALVCFLLLVVVLLQQGKGGDIAAAFGGSSSQAAFGARAGATVLTRATTILGALFMVGALALSVIGSSGGFGGSVVGGIGAPPASTATPATAARPLQLHPPRHWRGVPAGIAASSGPRARSWPGTPRSHRLRKPPAQPIPQGLESRDERASRGCRHRMARDQGRLSCVG